ncbi:hypothetical protein K4L44_06515 [Halosquirtibacter laminarini]|uniref:Uncharacterized protein n=1 Tax=Halosquirtibacter laminarini TaxID=3374600 RepID=A0AC61NID2_9BACT|nr:hypothetical protein K4L44_06515 [Prolixibacteraceae bacterium]
MKKLLLLLWLVSMISLITNAENKNPRNLYSEAITYEALTPELLESYSKFPVMDGVYYLFEKGATTKLIETKEYKIIRTRIPNKSEMYGYQLVQMRTCGYLDSSVFPQFQSIQKRKNSTGQRVDYSYAPGTDKHSFMKIEVTTIKDKDYVILIEKIVYKKRHSFKQKVTKPFRCAF